MRPRDFLLVSLVTAIVGVALMTAHLASLCRLELAAVRLRAEQDAHELAAVAGDAGAADAADAIARSTAVAALLEAKVASDSDIVFCEVRSQDGRRLIASSAAPDRLEVEPRPLTSLLGASWWVALGQLRRGALFYAEATATPWTVRTVVDTSLMRVRLERALRSSLGGVLLAVAGSWLLALLVAYLSRRPVRLLTRHLNLLPSGQFQLPQADAWDVDVGRLAQQLRTVGAEIRSERLKLLGKTATMGHLVEQLGDALFFLGPNDELAYFNRAASDVLGADLATLADRPLATVLGPSHPLVRLVHQARQAGQPIVDLAVSLPTQRRFRHTLASVFPILGDDGAVGSVVVLDDLGSIRALHSLVEYSARATSGVHLASSVVHEVKNLLNTMRLHTEVARDDQLTAPERRHSLDVVDGAIDRLDQLVRSFLGLSGPAEQPFTTVDLTRLVTETVEFLQMESEGARVTVELDVADRVTCRGNAELLRQCFINLHRNALEAMRDGGRLAIAVRRAATEAVVTFADQGCGIPEHDRDRIFDLHYTTKSQGSGVGLSVVRDSVARHGGAITVESQVDQGATFTIRLPTLAPSPPADVIQ